MNKRVMTYLIFKEDPHSAFQLLGYMLQLKFRVMNNNLNSFYILLVLHSQKIPALVG